MVDPSHDLLVLRTPRSTKNLLGQILRPIGERRRLDLCKEPAELANKVRALKVGLKSGQVSGLIAARTRHPLGDCLLASFAESLPRRGHGATLTDLLRPRAWGSRNVRKMKRPYVAQTPALVGAPRLELG